MEKDKKIPNAAFDKKDKLENKNQKNTDKKAASQNAIGEHEYEEDRSIEIRMKPQPFDKKKQPIRDRDTDGL